MIYTELVDKIEAKGCKFAWSEEEFETKYKNTKTNIDIISKCGHPSTVQCSNFLYTDTCVTCKQCTFKRYKDERVDKTTNYTFQEYNVIKAFQTYFKHDFEIKVLKEGCLADFCLKPLSISDDSWLPIQLKTITNSSHGKYCFTINNEYKDMLILLFCIENQHIWLLEGNEVIEKKIKRLCIGVNTSIYSRYQVKPIQLIGKLKEYYEKSEYNKQLHIINEPISQQMRNAIEMNLYRDNIMHMLQFTYPEIPYTVYDAVVNNKFKVQDKVMTCAFLNKTNKPREKREKPNYFVHLGRRRKSGLFAYTLGDNDYYWIHLPDKKGAYIIPENALQEHDLISVKEESLKINMIMLHPYSTDDKKKKNEWLNDHLYLYDKDIDRIIKLFDKPKQKIVNSYTCPYIIKD